MIAAWQFEAGHLLSAKGESAVLDGGASSSVRVDHQGGSGEDRCRRIPGRLSFERLEVFTHDVGQPTPHSFSQAFNRIVSRAQCATDGGGLHLRALCFLF